MNRKRYSFSKLVLVLICLAACTTGTPDRSLPASATHVEVLPGGQVAYCWRGLAYTVLSRGGVEALPGDVKACPGRS